MFCFLNDPEQIFLHLQDEKVRSETLHNWGSLRTLISKDYRDTEHGCCVLTAPRGTGGTPNQGAEQQAPEWVVETRPHARLERRVVLTHELWEEGDSGPRAQGRCEGASNNGSTLSSKREKGLRTPGWAKPHKGWCINRSGQSNQSMFKRTVKAMARKTI